MTSTDVTQVPDLAPTPATMVSFEDISPPTLYVAQRSSGAVGEGLVNYGDLFVAQSGDDPEPTVLWEFGSTSEGVLFHPLHMFKTWTHSDGSNLQSWDYGDGTPPDEAVALADSTGKPLFRTYNFTLFVPDYDAEMPVNLRLNSKSARPAANKINMDVSRGGGAWQDHAFRVTTVKKEKGANKWAVPVVVGASPEPANVESATRLRDLIMPGIIRRMQRDAATTNAPAI